MELALLLVIIKVFQEFTSHYLLVGRFNLGNNVYSPYLNIYGKELALNSDVVCGDKLFDLMF